MKGLRHWQSARTTNKLFISRARSNALLLHDQKQMPTNMHHLRYFPSKCWQPDCFYINIINTLLQSASKFGLLVTPPPPHPSRTHARIHTETSQTIKGVTQTQTINKHRGNTESKHTHTHTHIHKTPATYNSAAAANCKTSPPFM